MGSAHEASGDKHGALRLTGTRPALTTEDLVEGILSGDRVRLSRAITLVESTRPEHQAQAQDIIQACLPHTGRSLRLGITGVPGVGKSTFIESLGTRLTDAGHRLAVLAVDPSSTRSKGSILGDKTRMAALAADPQAFIRPSPSAGSLGGVARATRETMMLCEAAGYDIVFVETVGVGQSEVAVHAMVDFFLLLALPGAGDELQGIKRGIIEMADTVVVNKADGGNVDRARQARAAYRNALNLFPVPASGRRPPVLLCSAETGAGIDAVWETITEHIEHVKQTGFFDQHRRDQARHWMHQTIEQRLRDDFLADDQVQSALPEIERAVLDGALSSFAAAQQLLEIFYRSEGP